MTEELNQRDIEREFTYWHDEKFWIDPRRIFLDAVFDRVPETKDELINILATNGRESKADPEITRVREAELMTELGRKALASKEQGTLDQREKALAMWACKWNLTAPWCIEVAQQMILDPGIRFAQEQFIFKCPEWDRGVGEDRKVAKKRIRAAFENALRQHLDDRGWLNPSRQKNAAHFRWAVRYQVLGESHDTIAKSVGVSRQEVQRDLKKIWKVTGLTPRRKGPPGRPKKVNTQHSRQE